MNKGIKKWLCLNNTSNITTKNIYIHMVDSWKNDQPHNDGTHFKR